MLDLHRGGHESSQSRHTKYSTDLEGSLPLNLSPLFSGAPRILQNVICRRCDLRCSLQKGPNCFPVFPIQPIVVIHSPIPSTLCFETLRCPTVFQFTSLSHPDQPVSRTKSSLSQPVDVDIAMKVGPADCRRRLVTSIIKITHLVRLSLFGSRDATESSFLTRFNMSKGGSTGRHPIRMPCHLPFSGVAELTWL